MSEHAWVQENLDAFIAGGLSAQENERLERHVETCSECASLKAEIAELEQLVLGVCAPARPDAGLEDRAIQRLRRAPKPRPSWLRFVTAAAAVIVLGAVGGVVRELALNGTIPLPGMEGQVAQNELPREATLRPRSYYGVARRSDALEESVINENFGVVDVDPAATEFANDISRRNKQIAEVSVPGASTSTGSGATGPAKLPVPGDFGKEGQGGAIELYEAKKHKATAREPGFFPEKTLKELRELKDGIEKLDKDTKAKVLDDKPFFDKEEKKPAEDTAKNPDKMTKRDDAEMPRPSLPPTLTPPTQPLSPGPNFGPMPPSATVNSPLPVPPPYQPMTPPPVSLPAISPEITSKPGDGKPDAGGPKVGNGGDKSASEKPPVKEPPAQPKTEQKEPPPEKTGRMIIRTGDMEFETDSFDKARDAIATLITSVKGGFIATINRDTLPNGKTKGSVVVRMPPTALDRFILDLRRDLAKTSELKSERLGSLDITKQYTDIESRLRAARAIEDRLINIIKTGKGEIKDLVAAEKELGVWRTKIEEMEGEIRYYANQVSLSTLTISLTEKEIQAPTAIVVTDTVTVRIEVEDVAKAHQTAMKAVEDLKGRITRSELKQHTAGQFLSVLTAEIPPDKKDAFFQQLAKLGIVSDHQESQRQHLEGGSGKAPALKPRQADVVFQVTMNNTANVRPRTSADLKIATTDVPGSYNKLLERIGKAKGQIRDGKLNEQDKLNINAYVDFNVPISEKPGIDKLLEEIGSVLERVNIHAPLGELSTASKFGYTVHLRDYASIPPSKAAALKLATTDVPASYAKLLDAIAKVKGQLIDAILNEQDKFNISAQIVFSVPTDEKPAIDKLLTEIGAVLSRSNVQVPANQLSIVKKFGYSVTLRDLANILPTHAAELKVATGDVPGNYAKLVDAVVKAKGQMSAAKLNEQDKLNVSAFLNFTVPIEQKAAIDKLLGEFGTILSRNNVQAPASELTTDRKYGYAVSLRDFASIPPRESFSLQLAAIDVASAFRELQDAVTAAKGQIYVGQLAEDNKVKMEATLNFDVPAAERQAIEKLLAKVGAVVTRTSTQVPVSDLATDQKVGYKLTIRSTASIPPRETVQVKMEVKDVDARAADLKELVIAAKGRVIDANIDRHENGQVLGVLKFEVPASAEDSVLKQIKSAGTVVSQQAKRDPRVAENELTTAHIIVVLAGVSPIVPSDEGLSSYVRTSLYMSFKVFSVCLMLIILGVSAVLPWVLVIWAAYRIYVRLAGPRQAAAAAPAPTPPIAPLPG